MRLDEIIRTSLSRIETIRVRNALNPLLWVIGLTTPLCLLTIVLVSAEVIRLAVLGFAALPVIVALIAYILLLIRDPDRLQSEDYRLRQTALQIIRRKASPVEIVDVGNETPRFDRRDRAIERRRDG